MKKLKSIVMGMFLILAAAVPGFAVDGVLSDVIDSARGDADIYGNYIIWTDNQEIKLFNLQDSQTSIIGQGRYPRIYKDNVVWVNNTDKSVVKYDIKSGTTTIIGNPSYYNIYPPSIHGSKIVWSDNIEIRVYDIFSGQTTVLPVRGAYPVVYENMLTYLDTDDRDVHLYDMVRGVDNIIGTQSGMFYQALIDDSYIYWEGYDGSGYYTINRYDVSNNIAFNIALPQAPMCSSPYKFAISGGKVYFDMNCGGWHVYEFDPKTGSISALTAPTGTQSWAPAVYGNKVALTYSDGLRTFDITSPSKEVYSVNATADTVTVINPYKTDDPGTAEDDRIVATISTSTGAGPSDTALSPDETKLYILNSTAKTVTVAQTYDFVPVNTVNINPTNKQTATAVAGDNDSNTYVALKNSSSSGAGVVKKITSAGVETTLTVGVNPNGLKISPDNKKLLVSNGSSSNVTAIDLATFTIIEGNISTGGGPKIVRP